MVGVLNVSRNKWRGLSLPLIGLLLAIHVAALSLLQGQPPQRRPLPKPPSGTRGFEKSSGQDSSARLIAGGATRGVNPRKPVAPYEGVAYDARPFFLWETEPNSRTYHFTLFDGDVDKDAAAKIVFQTDVTVSELLYPKDAPKLTPGKLYSWRVSTPSGDGKQDGPAAKFTILAGSGRRRDQAGTDHRRFAFTEGGSGSSRSGSDI